MQKIGELGGEIANLKFFSTAVETRMTEVEDYCAKVSNMHDELVRAQFIEVQSSAVATDIVINSIPSLRKR